MGTLTLTKSDFKSSAGKGNRRLVSTSYGSRKRPVRDLQTFKTTKAGDLCLRSPKTKLFLDVCRNDIDAASD